MVEGLSFSYYSKQSNEFTGFQTFAYQRTMMNTIWFAEKVKDNCSNGHIFRESWINLLLQI